ncbi:hypothetical protein HZC20_01745 [Candidatus Peregrinibacteria bacterium]|nr:hypothetical protein [Candidatus Peregrinibacteria bacterium]
MSIDTLAPSDNKESLSTEEDVIAIADLEPTPGIQNPPGHQPATTKPLTLKQANPPGMTAKHGARFVNIPIPDLSGGEKSTRTDGWEEKKLLIDENSAEGRMAGELLKQMQAKRLKSRELTNGLKLASINSMTPDIILKIPIDLESLSFEQAMTYEKFFRRAAQNGKYHLDQGEEVTYTQADIDECWRRAMMYTGVATIREGRDLLVTYLLQDYHDRDLTDQFPDETVLILEAAIVNCKDERGRHRIEFLDTYFEFQKAKGKMKQAMTFIGRHLAVITSMDITKSSLFIEIITQHNEGDKLVFSMLKQTFGALLAIVRKGEAKATDKKLPRVQLIQSYIHRYCLCHKGDYLEAQALIRELRKVIPKIYPSGRIDFVGRRQEDTEDSRENPLWKHLEIETQLLIPNCYVEGDENEYMDRLDYEAEVAIKSLRGSGLPKILDALCREPLKKKKAYEEVQLLVKKAVEGDTDTLVNWIIEKGNAKDKELTAKLMSIPSALNELIETAENPRTIATVMERLFEAEEAGATHIPLDTQNIMLARLLEAYYLMEEDQKAIDLCNKARTKDWALLRGSAYYGLKCIFRAGNPEAKKQAVKGEGTPKIVQHAICLCEALHRAKSTHEASTAATTLSEKTFLPPCAAEDAIIRAAGHLIKDGKTEDAEKIIYKFPDYDKHRDLVAPLCLCLLSPQRLSRPRYEKALSLLERHSEPSQILKKHIEAAKERLSIESYKEKPLEDHIEEKLKDPNIQRFLSGDSNAKLAIIAGSLRETIRLARESLESTDIDWGSAQTETKTAQSSCLKQFFDIDSIRFEPMDKTDEADTPLPGNPTIFKAVCTLTPDKKTRLERKFITIEFGESFNMKKPHMPNSDTQAAKRALLARILEAACIENLAGRGTGGNPELTEDATMIRQAELDGFKRKVADFFTAQGRFEVKSKGIEGLKERNTSICERIAKDLPRMANDPNFPSDEERIGLIFKYIEILTRCRDMDRPDTSYNSATDKSNPLSAHVKYMRIFGKDVMAKILEDFGIPEEEARNYTATPGEKNNLAGYYELIFHSRETGEIPISVFLDRKGVAFIPGIDKTHPLYNHLWLLAVESLALKTVSEIGPYSRVLHTQGDKSKGGSRDISDIRPLTPEGAITPKLTLRVKRRIACSALMMDKPAEERNGHQKDKLKSLEEICKAFALIELGEKDITEWPMYTRDGRRYRKIEGLFFKKDEKTYVVKDKLKEIMPGENIEFEGEEVPMEEIKDEIRTRLMEAVRVKTAWGGERAYRMPVKFSESDYEITEMDGVEYFLVPAKGKVGKTMTKGGRLFRLEKVKSHTKVRIGNKKYMATPWEMSDEMERIYKETSTVEIDFGKTKVAYVVLYDKETNEILAYTHIGSAATDNGGNYTDKNLREYLETHNRGNLSIMKNPRVSAQFGERTDVSENFFFVETGSGYRQGYFHKIWKFLSEEHRMQAVAANMLLESIKNQVGEEARKALGDALSAETREENTDMDKKRKPSRPQEADSSLYEIIPEKPDSRNHERLRGVNLYRVEKGHPGYNDYAFLLSPNRDEAIVLVGGPDGQPVKVPKIILRESRGKKRIIRFFHGEKFRRIIFQHEKGRN